MPRPRGDGSLCEDVGHCTFCAIVKAKCCYCGKITHPDTETYWGYTPTVEDDGSDEVNDE
jgi:hypothetical protein